MDKIFISEDLGLVAEKDSGGNNVYFYPDSSEDCVGFFIESEDKTHYVFIPVEPIESLSSKSAFEKIFR